MPLHLGEKVHDLCHGKAGMPAGSSQPPDQPPGARSFPEKVWKQSHHPLLPLLSIEELWDGKPFDPSQFPIYHPPKDKVQRGVMTRKARGIRRELGLAPLPGEPEFTKDEMPAIEVRVGTEREWCVMRIMDGLEGVRRSEDYRRRQIEILRQNERERIKNGRKI